MMNPHVLLLGGNGRVARAMTRLMVSRSWRVTSVVRNPQHKEDILRLGANEAVQCDLRRIQTVEDASQLIEKHQPSCVVFAAGSFSSPYEIDRDAAQHFIQAACQADHVHQFLMISFPASRRHPAPWWSKQDIASYRAECETYPHIQEAKLQADECLISAARQRELRGGKIQAISLRPSWLLTSPPTGKVLLGKTPAVGQVSIDDVAAVAVSLLSRNDTNGWVDLVEGDMEIDRAVDALVENKVNSIEGEDVERMCKVKRLNA
ncbi:NAD(P)-binding protein [Aspergillus sclerotiicarbonarius CBS 121057]|uniref:NAD(P)-binding protein n=1 Tax=Aspergillus sclerotiicarbonarius (strain CBS 121057 / IBT 28362) TaxID=1448318 RepID=A0A319DZW6_ASPSB|nr:NAD(P)-binding protein [Aspergillus sclerotiicarbonarius CBS 121057]